MFNFRHFIRRCYLITSFMLVMRRRPVFIVIGAIEIFNNDDDYDDMGWLDKSQ